MIQVRDASRGIDESCDIDVVVDLCTLKTLNMDRQNFPNDRFHTSILKDKDFSQFISKEFQGGFPDDSCCSGSGSVDFPWPLRMACHGVVSESEDESIKFMSLAGHSSSMECPATKALDTLGKREHRRQNGIQNDHFSSPKMIQQKSLKRDRSTIGQFDFTDLLDVTQPMNDSIAFPSIEWNSDDDEENLQPNPTEHESSQDDTDELIQHPRAKRHCRGLVRSREIACNLHRLEGIS